MRVAVYVLLDERFAGERTVGGLEDLIRDAIEGLDVGLRVLGIEVDDEDDDLPEVPPRIVEGEELPVADLAAFREAHERDVRDVASVTRLPWDLT